jgi:hypothetical protein
MICATPKNVRKTFLRSFANTRDFGLTGKCDFLQSSQPASGFFARYSGRRPVADVLNSFIRY